ncbi:MAG TPA: thiamine-phosphate kinase, partial [Thermoplasmata archaeon]|nr:thiamine-phosphate kinase [Thermoplasmata archaeon]
MATVRRARRPFVERAFHAWLARTLPAGRTGTLPLGDDVAAVPLPRAGHLLLTSDALVEATHFLAASPPRAVGAAAMAVSLSDLAAKGGRPAAALLDLLLPPATPPAWARAVALGAERMAARYGAHVVGGDTKAAPVRAAIGALLGTATPGRLPSRDAARPGDVVVVTGTVGRGGLAAVALAEHPASPRALARALAVEPRLEEGEALRPYARAMTDTSDGVADSAWLVAQASGVGIVLDEAVLPWAPGLADRADSAAARRAIAFYGGDYELLATVPSGALAAARAAVRDVGGRLTAVGRVVRGAGAFLGRGPRRRSPLPRAGWDPFKPRAPGPGARLGPAARRGRR